MSLVFGEQFTEIRSYRKIDLSLMWRSDSGGKTYDDFWNRVVSREQLPITRSYFIPRNVETGSSAFSELKSRFEGDHRSNSYENMRVEWVSNKSYVRPVFYNSSQIVHYGTLRKGRKEIDGSLKEHKKVEERGKKGVEYEKVEEKEEETLVDFENRIMKKFKNFPYADKNSLSEKHFLKPGELFASSAKDFDFSVRIFFF